MARDELSDYLEELKKEVYAIALSGVIDEMKNIEVEVINDVVYDAYEPTLYVDRRREKDGLSDKSNMKPDYVKTQNGIIVGIQNETRGNTSYPNSTNGYISDIIESGDGYSWKNSGIYGTPRPFQEITQERIDNGTEVEEVIERALLNRGYVLK